MVYACSSNTKHDVTAATSPSAVAVLARLVVEAVEVGVGRVVLVVVGQLDDRRHELRVTCPCQLSLNKLVH